LERGDVVELHGPRCDLPHHGGVAARAEAVAINGRIRALAAARHLPLIDYNAALAALQALPRALDADELMDAALALPLRTARIAALTAAWVEAHGDEMAARVRAARDDARAREREIALAPRGSARDVARAFELAYCLTVHRSQCETIRAPFALHDVDAIVRAPPACVISRALAVW
jgi:hypothetical protein